MPELIYQHAHAAGEDSEFGPGKNSFDKMWEVAEDKLRFHKGKGFTIAQRPNPDPGPSRKLAVVGDLLEPQVEREKVDTVFAVRANLDGYTILIRKHEAPLSKGDLVVAAAARRVGTPYDFGVTDCSWLTQQSVEDVIGMTLPHNAHAQRLDPRTKEFSSRSQLKPGDLVFIDDDAHVAVYLDNQYGGRVWDTEPHDTSVPPNWMPDNNGMLGTGVRIRPMFLPWYCGRIVAFGRIPEVNGSL